MTNEQLIKSGHIWALAILLACGAIAVAATNLSEAQNSNQNGNSNSSQSNSNRNMNRNSNMNSSGSMSGMSGMSGMALSSADRNFVMEAAMGGMMEVELGRMAAQMGMSAGVKQFGQRMVDDHSKANSELMTVAANKGITLPTELDQKHKDKLAKMQKMTGAQFDNAYLKEMVSDHEKDVAMFEKESMKGGDADVKMFASNTLPTLREHLDQVRSLNGQKSGSKSGSSNSNSNSNSNN
jgi:putative membrane protein